MQALRTFHGHFQITHKSMDHTQGLCDSHQSFSLGQSIQSLDNGLYLTLPKQFLCEFLCGIMSHESHTCGIAPTEPTLLNLLCRQGKH